MVGLQVAVVHWGPLQRLFGSVALSARDRGFAVAVAAGLVVVEELRKALRRLVRPTRGERKSEDGARAGRNDPLIRGIFTVEGVRSSRFPEISGGSVRHGT